MKNKLKLALSILSLVAIISSCSTSNDVASNRRIQKRKYTKGFSISKNDNVAFNKKHKATTTVEIKDIENISEINTVKAEKTINSTVTNSAIIEETTIVTPSNEVANMQVDVNETNSVAENKTNNVLTIIEDVKTVETNNLKSKTKTVKKKSKKNSLGANGFAVGTILLVILAIFIPPLAVFLFEGVTTRFWIDLILALIVVGYLFATIYALLIVLGVI